MRYNDFLLDQRVRMEFCDKLSACEKTRKKCKSFVTSISKIMELFLDYSFLSFTVVADKNKFTSDWVLQQNFVIC